MSKKDYFNSVWDALEDDPVRQENLELRSALMMEIAERIEDRGLTQTQAAEVLHITQSRVSQRPSAREDQRFSSGQPGRHGPSTGHARFHQRGGIALSHDHEQPFAR